MQRYLVYREGKERPVRCSSFSALVNWLKTYGALYDKINIEKDDSIKVKRIKPKYCEQCGGKCKGKSKHVEE